MKTATYISALVIALAASFIAGSRYSNHSSSLASHEDGRKVLYYIDPMHPDYKADSPGIAPDCGMQLEPVYAADPHTADTTAENASLPHGTVRITPERQQLIGVRTRSVQKGSGAYNLSLVGRVVADETRVYTLNAGTSGYVQDVTPLTTGSHVRKHQLLATFSAPNAVMTMQTFLLNLGAQERFTRAVSNHGAEADALPAANANVQQRTQQLQELGMSLLQIEEMKRTRVLPTAIKIISPVDGFVLGRSVSPGLRFERGAEWYRIANFDRVWIVADVFDKDAPYVRPGMTARISVPNRTTPLRARVSDVPPQADPAKRSLKVRLEVDNPHALLRPDMLVDVTLQVNSPQGITVPAEAVLDTGVQKTVFVDRGNGYFEPRPIETGLYFDDQVEVKDGLAPGERIVVSGNFLISSESQLKTVFTHPPPVQRDKDKEQHATRESRYEAAALSAQDPVCGMRVDTLAAKAAGHVIDDGGTIHYFCSTKCKRKYSDTTTLAAQTSEKSASPQHLPYGEAGHD